MAIDRQKTGARIAAKRAVIGTLQCLWFASAGLSIMPGHAAPRRADAPIVTESVAPAGGSKPLMALGAGDVINMQVYGRPELATTVSIAEDGTLNAPLVGSVPVAGLSVTDAANKVASAYKKGQYLRNPQITILVTQARSQLVSVFGEVRSPGRFAVDASTTVFDLIAQAGGTTERSSSLMYVIRADANGEIKRRAIDLRGLHNDGYQLQSLALQGGDSVFVPPAEHYYIYGEVNTPSMYRLEPNMTVLQAISRGGGLTKVASKRVQIKRRDSSGQLLTRNADLNETVQPDDVIYVKESLF